LPAPNLAHLQAQPNLLLTWLNDNLLLAGLMTNVPNPPGLAWVTITAPPVIPGMPSLAVNASGRPMDVFTLRTNGGGVGDSVRSYVCNYTANGVHSIDLVNAADYCFTVTLNGCTFGIGPRTPLGFRRVSHANTGGNAFVQRTQTWTQHGVPANSYAISLLEPSEYRRLGGGGNLNATVFGVRTGVSWAFYFQLYTAVGNGNYKVHGVFPIRVP